jgi:hypothetical protein
MTIRYILCSFGTFFPVLVSCTKKNLATLSGIERMQCEKYSATGRKNQSISLLLKIYHPKSLPCDPKSTIPLPRPRRQGNLK